MLRFEKRLHDLAFKQQLNMYEYHWLYSLAYMFKGVRFWRTYKIARLSFDSAFVFPIKFSMPFRIAT